MPEKLNGTALAIILQDIRYREWEFCFQTLSSGSFLVWIRFEADGESWTSRKWYVSQHSTRSEVVQTCLKAVLTAEEHEAREKFLYRGRALFGPHLHVDELLEIAECLDPRPAQEVTHG